MHKTYKFIFVILLFVVDAIVGQVNISAGNTVTQNFDGIGVSATATLPSGWKADKNTTVRSVGTYTAAGTATEQRAGNSMSSSATNGIYNYAAGDPTAATDRAIGGISSSSSSKSVNLYVQLTNNGGSTISNFTISYNVEKYRKGTNAAGFSIQMYYSTNGIAWTSAGSDFLTSFTGGEADNSGYTTAPGATTAVSSKTLSQSLANGSSLYLAWNYSVTSGTTTSNAQGLGVDDISITANSSLSTPPTLTADATLNNVDNNIDITFTDDAAWRAAMTAVKIGGTSLTLTTDYVLSSGNLQLKPAGGNSLLTTAGSKNVTVEATGYSSASVTQQINAGAPTSNSTATINSELALGTTRTVTATAKDQYNNVVSGYTFKYDATITNNNTVTNESYTIDGTARTATVLDVSVVTATNSSGVATFDISVPAVVDGNDGVSVQTQLNNGTTNIGSAFSYTAPSSPSITVGSVTDFGNQVVNTNSAEKTYNVTGINLTADINVTAPTAFQVSKTSGSGFASSVSLIQSGGNVNQTVYVRFSPTVANGSDTGSISHTSTGAETKTVYVSGNALSTEPTAQSTISIGTVTENSIPLTFTGGNGTYRIVAALQGSSVTYTPTDGSAPSGIDSNFTIAADQGSGNKVIYNGTGTSVTVTGLTAATTYYFAVYEYNSGTGTSQNYLTTNPGTASGTTSVTTYTWNNPAGGDFQTASNWTPSRISPSVDALVFNTGGKITVTNVPTQTIAKLTISGSTHVELQAGGANTLTINKSGYGDLLINSSDTLTVSGTSAMTISIAAGNKGDIYGAMILTGAAHKLLSADTASVSVYSGGSFTSGTGLTGNVFGTGNLNSIKFLSGSYYNHYAGSNPFGASAPNSVVVWMPGSTYRHYTSSITPSISNRTYANFEYMSSGSMSPTSANGCTMDSLIVNAGTLSISVRPEFTIKGNIYVASGATLNFNPSATGTIVLAGTAAQKIRGTGTLTFSSFENVKINNANNVYLQMDLSLSDSLFLTSGNLILGVNNLTLSASSPIIGTPSSSNMIIADSTGELRKTVTANISSSLTLPVGGVGVYSPVTVTSLTASGYSSAYLAVKLRASKHTQNNSGTNYLSRYWTFSGSGITSPVFSANFSYTTGDVHGLESNLYGGKYNGMKWIKLDKADSITHQFTASAQTAFSDFTAGESDHVGGAALVNFKAIPEAYYDSVANKLAMKDTFTVYLANTSSPYAFVDSSTVIIDSLTFTGQAVFRNAADASYYHVFGGRALVQTWSAAGQTIEKGTTSTYDFTTSSAQAFGNNMILKGGQWCIYTGDVNQDAFVDFSDLGLVDNDAYNYMSGYTITDINGDSFVDFTDLGMVDNNAYNYIGVAKPGAKSAKPVQTKYLRLLSK